MSLAVKYRPKNFREFIGNAEVVASLRSMIGRDEVDLHHSCMMTGPAGCGKTTLARIAAHELGIHPDDLVEINASDFRGIDTIREIIKSSKLKPMHGKRKAWILDEAHNLTKDAQNSLLKLLEEPPSHAFFFLATTDPQLLLKTIITRCPNFEVRLLEEDELEKVVRRVLKAEGITEFPKNGIEMIVANALGSARTALTILDQVIDLDDETMLKTIDKAAARENQTIELCQALLKRESWPKIAGILKNIQGEPETIRRAVLGYFTAVMLNKLKADFNAALVMDCFSDNYFNTGKAGLVLSRFEAIVKDRD